MNTQLSTNTINLLGIRKKVVLAPFISAYNDSPVHIIAITDKEEEQLDRRSQNHIFFYGDINLVNKDDLDIIRNYDFYFKDGKGMLYTNFDYDRGLFTLVSSFNGKDYEPIVKWGPCISPIEWFKYAHCLLGKPAKVAVYNGTFKLF